MEIKNQLTLVIKILIGTETAFMLEKIMQQ
jgi:hypothetical protein